MPPMIGRLPHPVRGIVVFLALFWLGSMLGGFAMGLPELALLALAAAAVAGVIATRTSEHPGPSD